MIRLCLPAALRYRDLAIRAVAAACKLVGADGGTRGRDSFDDEVISAFSEAFNNAAIHCYGKQPGDIEIEIRIAVESITIELRDHGDGFDYDAVPTPDLDALPESGLGIFIMKSFMDEVRYQLGGGVVPNVLTLHKRYPKTTHEGAAESL